MIRRGAVAVVVLLIGVAVLVVGDAMASVWSLPGVLAPNVQTRKSAVETAGGETVAAWVGDTGVFAAVADVAGRFAPAERLSDFKAANDFAQLLATDSRGDAIVVWQQQHGGNPSPGSLFVSYRPANGAFGPRHLVALHTGGAVVGMDARGDTTIAWEQFRRHVAGEAIDVTERRADGRFGPVHGVARGDVSLSSLAVDGRNRAVLVWQAGPLPRAAVLAATRSPTGMFGEAIQLVSQRQGATAPKVGIDRAGRAWVAWEGPYDGLTAGNPYRHVEVAPLSIGARKVGAVQQLRTPGLGQLGDPGPLLDVDQRGDALVVWQNLTRDGNTVKIVIARRRARHPFTNGKAIGNSYNGGNFNAAISSNGRAIVSWDTLTGPIQAAIAQSPITPFGHPTSVAPSADLSAEPAVAINPQGRAIAIWQDLGAPTAPAGPKPLLYATTR